MNNKLIERIDLVLPDEKFAEFSSLTDVLRDCKAALNKCDTQQQRLIGSRARLQIEIAIAESLIEDPNYEVSAIDCEYWNAWHDKLKSALTQQQEAVPVAWGYCPECGCEKYQSTNFAKGRFCADCGQEWFGDLDYTEVVRGHLAKLRPPKPAAQPQVPEGYAQREQGGVI